MHPPFRPRLAARSNPKNGLFEDSPRELRELSAAIDADAQIKSDRVTLARMLMARGEDKNTAFMDVDGALYAAWDSAKGADRLNALRRALREMKRELDASAKQSSLTGATEDGDDTEADVEDTQETDAERRLSEKERERRFVDVLSSYGLTPELYEALIKGSVTQEGRVALRTDDAALAQQTGRSVKDIKMLRGVAFMLSLHKRGDVLLRADELEDQVSRVM